MDRDCQDEEKESKLFLHPCVFILCILSIPVNFFFLSHSNHYQIIRRAHAFK